MTDRHIIEMLLDVLGHVDYDIKKDYMKETAEEPEFVDEELAILVEVVRKHMGEKQ